MFCEGKGPFRWAALSGEAADIAAIDKAIADLFPDDDPLQRWIRLAGERVAFQGLPARICWLGYGERWKLGERMNELVADGTLEAPIVIGRDHLDTGSFASPYRETEDMADGSDAIADWPILNALLNTASERRGCPSTTAAGSGSASAFTPDRSRWLTVPRTAPVDWSAFSRMTLASASHATRTLVRARARDGPQRGVRIPMIGE